jgi:hypothetical protein
MGPPAAGIGGDPRLAVHRSVTYFTASAVLGDCFGAVRGNPCWLDGPDLWTNLLRLPSCGREGAYFFRHDMAKDARAWSPQ